MCCEQQKIIIDCDPGADDAQAILIALNAPHIEIVAITTVFGNTKVENTYMNALRLLKFCKREDIPVFKGCDRNLIMDPSVCGKIFGSDGFGDVEIPEVDPVDVSLNPTEHASIAMCNFVSQYPGEITLIAMGCLTNIATCLKLDPEFGLKLKDCVIMGGNHQGRGNSTPAAECNFGEDPESARAVLEGLGIISTIMTYETCVQYSASWKWYKKYTSYGTKLSELMRKIDGSGKMLKDQNSPCYHLFDQFAVAAVVDPSIVEEAKDVYTRVELHGELSRGLVVVDWQWKWNKSANVRLVTRLDDKKCQEMMLDSIRMF